MRKRYRTWTALFTVLALLLVGGCQAGPAAGSGEAGSISVPPAGSSEPADGSGQQTPPEEPGSAAGSNQQPEEESPSQPPEESPDSSAQSPAQEPQTPAEEQPPQEPQMPEEEQPAPEPQPPEEKPPVQTPDPPPEKEEPPKANHKLYILMYHDVVEGDGSGCNNWTITTDRLREDLQWMTDNGFTFYLPSELARGTALAEKAVMITFDDGYASNYTLAFPILKEFNAKAAISPIVKRIEDGVPGFLTWDMCREMADSGLVEFGSHTYDAHRESPRGIQRMEGESREAYEARMFPDLQTSIDLLEENLGREVCFFAYPHGQTERWASDFLAEHFSVSVTTDHGPANLAKGLYNLPRHNVTIENKASKWLS